jgi:hypothetical protein
MVHVGFVPALVTGVLPAMGVVIPRLPTLFSSVLPSLLGLPPVLAVLCFLLLLVMMLMRRSVIFHGYFSLPYFRPRRRERQAANDTAASAMARSATPTSKAFEIQPARNAGHEILTARGRLTRR